jgi:hypothetical protein
MFDELKEERNYFRLLKKDGRDAAYSMQWFANAIKIGTYKIPKPRNQYEKIKDDVEVIDLKK